MDTENMKNMVVLKNLPSNIVEEAIVILKPNIKLKSLDAAEKKGKSKNINNKSNKQGTKKYIINEAEMVIGNYLSKIENDKKRTVKINKKIETKYKRLRAISILLGFMLFISLAIKF